MTSNNALMSQAFIRQAKTDMDIYEQFSKSNAPACHTLHYLQMWLEKLCKASLWNPDSSQSRPPNFEYSHNVISKVLPHLITSFSRRLGVDKKYDTQSIRAIRDLCQEIDYLAPAVDADGRRPDNSEYPWPTGDLMVQAPVDYTFPLSRRLFQPAGKEIIRVSKLLTSRPDVWLQRN